MVVDFNSLPDDARVWIYQASRPFQEDELEKLNTDIKSFLAEWAAHGKSLKAGYEIKYKRFLIIGLDQKDQHATGCSIDAQVHFIQQLENELDMELLDKMNVTYRTGKFIAYKPLADFKKMVKNKSVNADTIVFNNLVNTKGEYLEHWEVPATESWHARFF